MTDNGQVHDLQLSNQGYHGYDLPIVTAHDVVGTGFNTHLVLWQEGHTHVIHRYLNHFNKTEVK